MAINKKIDSGGLKFDHDLDFEMDDNFGMADSLAKQAKSRSPAVDFVSGVGEGVKSKLKSGAFWNALAKKALPESYSIVESGVRDTAQTLGKIYSDSSKALKPDLLKIGRNLDKLIPAESKRLKAAAKRLGIGPEESSGYSSPSQEQLQDQAILNSQSQIFDKISQENQAREARETVDQRVRDRIDSKRFSSSINILSGIHDSISRVSSYTTTVNAAYQKKSLELQYRSYFVQTEMLKSMEKANETSRVLMESIRHNTGLPDFAKLHTYERFKEMTQTKILGGLQSGIGAVLKRIGARAGRYISEGKDLLNTAVMGTDAVVDQADMLKSLRESGLGTSGAGMGGNLAGGWLTDWMVNKFGDKAKKFFPKGGKVSNTVSQMARFFLDPQSLAKNIRGNQKFKDKTDWADDSLTGKGAKLLDMFLGDFITPDRDRTIARGQELGTHRDAVFDRRVYKSITEVIPGYLARMLQYQQASFQMNRMMAGLDPTTDPIERNKKIDHLTGDGNRMVFDWKMERFTMDEAVQQEMKARMANEGAAKTGDWVLEQSAKEIAGDNLGEEENKRIKKFLHRLGANTKIDYASEEVDDLVRADNQLTDLDKATLLAGLSRLRNDGEDGKLAIVKAMMKAQATVQYQDIEASKYMEAMHREGHLPQMLKAGLVKQDAKTGNVELDREKVMEWIRENGITGKASAPESTVSDLERLLRTTKNRRYNDNTRTWEERDDEHSPWRVMGTSDRNVKRNIRTNQPKGILDRLKDLKTYAYKYAGERREDATHGGYMAQEVNKEFGNTAAPGGTVVDHSHMNALNTEGLKELNQKVEQQSKDPSSIQILRSIDRRLRNMEDMNRYAMGAVLDKEVLRRIFKGKVPEGRPSFSAPSHRQGLLSALGGLAGQAAGAAGNAVGFIGNTLKRGSDLFFGTQGKLQVSKEKLGKLGGELQAGYDGALQRVNSVLGSPKLQSAKERLSKEIKMVCELTGEHFSNARDWLANMKDETFDAMTKEQQQMVLRMYKVRSLAVRLKKTGNEKAKDSYDKLVAEYARLHDKLKQDGVIPTTAQVEEGFRGIASYLGDAIGWGFGAAKSIGKAVFGAQASLTSNLKAWVTSASQRYTRWVAKPRDLYVPGNTSQPVIVGAMMAQGLYVDKDGKAITNLEQLKRLTGPLYKLNGANLEIAVTVEQMENGLYDVQGNKLSFISTSLRDAVLGTAGWVAGNALENMNKVRKFLFGVKKKDDGKEGGEDSPDKERQGLFSSLFGAAKGSLQFAGDTVGKLFGSSSSKSSDALIKILKILQRWDKKGMGYGEEEVPVLPTDVPATDEASAAVPGGVPEAPTPTGGMGIIGKGASFLRGKARGWFDGAANSSVGRKVGGWRDRLRGGAVGTAASGAAARVGGLFGGRVGRLGGWAKEKMAGGLGALFPATDPNAPQDPNASSPASQPGVQPGASAQATGTPKTASVWSRLSKSLKAIPFGKRKWNDTDGDGYRQGDWRSRIEEMKAADEVRKQKTGQVTPGADPAKYQGEGFMGKIWDFMKGGLGKLFGMAGGLLGSLGKGLLGTLAGAAKGVGALARGGMGLSRLAGGPLARGVGAIARSGVGKFALRWAGRAAIVAGVTALAGSGAVAATGAAVAMGIAGLGAVLGSPVLLGALAIGATGYGLYKTYKYFTRNSIDDYQKLRYLQYGFAEGEGSHFHLLAELEGYLTDGRVGYRDTSNGEGKEAYVLESKVDPAEMVKIFDIDPENTEDVERFTEWYKGRFEPFFLTAVTALYRVNPKTKLLDVNDLEPGEKAAYVKASRYDNGPYDRTTSPLKQIPELMNTAPLVKKMADGLETANTNDETRQKEKKKEGWLLRMAKLTPPGYVAHKLFQFGKGVAEKLGVTQSKEEEKKKLEHDKQMAAIGSKAAASVDSPDFKGYVSRQAGQIGAAASSSLVGATVATTLPDAETPDLGKGSGGVPADKVERVKTSGTVATPTTAGGGLKDGAGGMPFVKLESKRVRLEGLNPSMLRNFLGMAQEYGELTGKSIQVNSAYRARGDKHYSPGSMHSFGLAMDIQSKDANALEKMGLMRKYGFTRPVGQEPWHIEPAGVQANLTKAKENSALAEQMIAAGLYKGGGGYALVGGSRMGGRDKATQIALLNSPVSIRTDETQREEKLTNASTVAKVTSAANDSRMQSTKAEPGSYSATVANRDYNVVSNGRHLISQQTAIENVLPDTESAPFTVSGEDETGKVEPTDRQGVLNAIAQHAKKTGVPARDLQIMAAVESSLDPSPQSSGRAKGLFQFMPGTWSEYLRKHGSKYGLSPNESPTNIKASTVLAGEYVKANLQSIRSVRPNPTLVDAYLAHFLGARGARRFYEADPSTIAAQLFPEPAANNRAIFYDGSRPRTIQEVYVFLAKKLEKAAKDFGIGSVTLSSNLSTNKTAPVNTPSMTSPVSKPTGSPYGDYSIPASETEPVVRRPKESMVPTPPVVTSNRITEKAPDAGENAMSEFVDVANQSLNIHRQSLNTVNEIRDMIRELVKHRSSSNVPAAPAVAPRAPARPNVVEPLLDSRVKRSF